MTAAAQTGREIKTGFVGPQTGAIASFRIPNKYCVDGAKGTVVGDKETIKTPVKKTKPETYRIS